MNTHENDPIDDRLRQADPAVDKAHRVPAVSAVEDSRGNSVRDWWLTTSSRVRRSLGVGLATSAAATVVIAGSLNGVGGPLIHLGEGTPPSAMSARGSSENDAKMSMPFVNYEYVAGPSLSNDSGRGRVYRVERAGTAESVARNAADYFGVVGDVQKSQYFDPAWPTYVVGDESGLEPSVTVSWTGTGTWWYSNPAAYPEQKCLREHRVGKGKDAYVECAEWEPAVTGLNPNETETRQLAAEFFSAMGVTFDPADITVMVDEWSSFASVALVVDGQATAIEWSISWSGNGELSWAQGNSVTIVDAGEFGTVSAVAAVDRLNDWRWFGSGPTDYSGNMVAYSRSASSDVAVSGSEEGSEAPLEPTAESTDPAVPTETPEPAPTDTESPVEPESTESETPAVEPTEDSIPLPSEPEIPVQTITVTTSTPTLLVVWDESGDAWLVPGMFLSGDDWWGQNVITLVEGVIELPEPYTVMPID